MWAILAIFSSISAAFVAIFGKLGLTGIDSTLATTLRSIIMAIFLIITSLALGKFSNFHLKNFTSAQWLFIAAAGLAGAISWLFYFAALAQGQADKVAAIDRTSIVFIVVFAGLFLGESLTPKTILGAILMVVGSIIISGK